MLHYSQLRKDLISQIKRIATFLQIDAQRLDLETIRKLSDFNYMKSNAEKFVPFSGQHMQCTRAFFHKGPLRDFRTELSALQIKRFDESAMTKLGMSCAYWLETGDEEVLVGHGRRSSFSIEVSASPSPFLPITPEGNQEKVEDLE